MNVETHGPNDVHFQCASPQCAKRAQLKGNPERCIEIAKALGWEVVEEEHVGPIPLLASALCWQHHWLASDSTAMRAAVRAMFLRTETKDPLKTTPAERGKSN